MSKPTDARSSALAATSDAKQKDMTAKDKQGLGQILECK